MATTTLTLGAVTLTTPFPGTTPHPESVVVGSPPQWSDGSDATYATVHNKFHATEPWVGTDLAVASLAPFGESPVTAVSVTVRVSSSSGGAQFVQPFIYSTAAGPFASPATQAEEAAIDGDGSIQTVTVAFLDDDPDPAFNSLAQATGALAAGATLRFGAMTFGTNLTIYEASITVTTGQPATRLWPRDDALGLGSAPRLVPPPKAARIVGGYL